MKKTKFTPGPWRIETENETGTPTISIRDGLNQQIATVNPYRLAWRDADARLIAAAPEMLEALESLVERCSHLKNLNGVQDIIAKQIDDAKAAIAKARGKQRNR